MAKKIILHIGRHKCGTTSIQRVLFLNRDQLKKMGILYPAPPQGDIAHHQISRALSGGNQARGAHVSLRKNIRSILDASADVSILRRLYRVFRHTLQVILGGGRSNAEKIEHNRRDHANESDMERFREVLLNATEHTVVVSSEAFQNCSPKAVRHYLRDLDVYPVCYIREQSAYLRSAYSQRIQASYYRGSVQQYYRKFFHGDYLRFIKKWQGVFGENLLVRRFERDKLVQGDAVHDFLSAVLKLEPQQCDSLQLPAQENPSLSALMLSFKQRLNREGYLLDPKIYRLLTALDSSDSAPYQLPADLENRVRGAFRRSNQSVARQFFQEEELFNLPDSPAAVSVPELEDSAFLELLEKFDKEAPGCIRSVLS